MRRLELFMIVHAVGFLIGAVSAVESRVNAIGLDQKVFKLTLARPFALNAWWSVSIDRALHRVRQGYNLLSSSRLHGSSPSYEHSPTAKSRLFPILSVPKCLPLI